MSKMKFIANEIKHRGHLQQPLQTANTSGGFDRTYTTLTSFWLSLEAISSYVKAIRGVNRFDGITQIAKVRYTSLTGLGTAFTTGFSDGFDTIEDINPAKENYFLFIEGPSSTRGRLFKVMGLSRDEFDHTWMRVQLQEIEERGTGYQS